MAFDALTISAIVQELNEKLIEGRITKINQPEKDEITLQIRTRQGNERLIISANASIPLMYIDNNINKENPLKAPDFCMVLRKYLLNGRILDIVQIDCDRLVEFKISHYDELGDLCNLRLIVELMGKYSNIILVGENDTVLESIKHINGFISSVREVYPGTKYFKVTGKYKLHLEDINNTKNMFQELTLSSKSIRNMLVSNFALVSPTVAEELCFLSNIDSSRPASTLRENELDILIQELTKLYIAIQNKLYKLQIYYDNNKPMDYSVINMNMLSNLDIESFGDVSSLLKKYYEKRNHFARIQDRSSSIRQILHTNIERLAKKLNLWEAQLKDCDLRDKYKLYGELILTYAYLINKNSPKINCTNYYNNSEVTIDIDVDKTAVENSQIYYNKYNKLKRTKAALETLIIDAKDELEYLQSILESISNVQTQDDLLQIKIELANSGYVKKAFSKGKKNMPKSKPLHYKDNLDYDYYVGKNNIQNEEVTFEIASNLDWWFHVKAAPGAHVIVKRKGNEELPDIVYLKAAALAAFYSQLRNDKRVEVDYIQKKYIKKPNLKKPGMVIYHTNYSMNIEPSIDGLELKN